MIQCVMLFSVGNGYTWSSDIVRPVMAESCEHALVEFETKYAKAKAGDCRNREFFFAGVEYETHDFECDGKFYPPEFLTIDEWFTRDGESV